MPQDEIEWHGAGRGASKPAGRRVADPHEEAGARAHILAQEDQEDGHRRPRGGTVFTSSAGSKSRLRKTPMTTTTILGEGEVHPRGELLIPDPYSHPRPKSRKNLRRSGIDLKSTKLRGGGHSEIIGRREGGIMSGEGDGGEKEES